jgi:hypothetical protein
LTRPEGWSALAIVNRSLFVALGSSFIVACGSSAAPEPPKAPPEKSETQASASSDPAPAEAAAASSTAAHKIPTECVDKDGACTVGKDFTKRLCESTYPNVALVLFAKGSPWQREFLTRKTQAWNAEGGASVAGFVEFDEEVLVLDTRAQPKGGMVVSGAGGVQALRWDGSCVTLQSEEVTTTRPPKPKHPRLEWRWFDDAMKAALRKDSDVDAAYLAQRKECKGVSSGDVSKKCVDMDNRLVDAIVQHVENGGELAAPEQIP